jgi:hypothetical protein
MGHFPRTQKIMNLPSLAPDIQEEMSRPRSWAADSSSCDGSTRASLAIVTDERERPVYAGTGEEFLETHTYFGILIKPPISDASLSTAKSHVFRHAFCVPDSHTIPRNRVFGGESERNDRQPTAKFEAFLAPRSI